MKYFLLIIAFLTTFVAFAQKEYTSDSKKAIKLYEEGRELLRQRMYDSKKFFEGIEVLKKSVEKDPNFAEAHLALAGAYMTIGKKDEKELHLLKFEELMPPSEQYGTYYVLIGDVYFERGEYEKALKNYNLTLKFNNSKPDVMAKAEVKKYKCEYGIEAKKHPLPMKPEPMPKNINRFVFQYFPALTADGENLLYSVRTGQGKEHDENLVIAHRSGTEWSEPKYIEEINTSFNEGACTMSSDGKTLVFASCYRRDSRGGCDLYMSQNEGGEWQEPVNLGDNVNSRAWESHPSLSADGRTLYFASNRGGYGEGAEDIWYSELNDDGEWGKARGLSMAINTPFSEVSPFIHANGKTLFFASHGHMGMGGLDLFYSQKTDSGWSKPVNLGYPINDQMDNEALFISADGEKGYFSITERGGFAYNGSKLYEFAIPKELKVFPVCTYAKGHVYDAVTKEPIRANVQLYDIETDLINQSVHSDKKNGDYLLVLTEGSEYALNVNAEGYLFKSMTFNYKDQSSMHELSLDIYLEPVKPGAVTILNNIFFESGKYDLQPKSKTEIRKMAEFLQQNPTVRVEISGHTDDVGSDQANMTLSRQRAKAVYDFLLKVNVPKEMLTYKGYGETQPVKENTSAENRAANRRIEFKVLK